MSSDTLNTHNLQEAKAVSAKTEHNIMFTHKLDALCYHIVKTLESLSHLGTIRYRLWQTDGWTDRHEDWITI